MGMCDTDEPQPPFDCPVCGGPSIGWQGKDGPCAMFLWHQGQRHPVDQPIDADARIERARHPEFTLARTFELRGWCAQEHEYRATGHAPSRHLDHYRDEMTAARSSA
jgi:hypothetical protein